MFIQLINKLAKDSAKAFQSEAFKKGLSLLLQSKHVEAGKYVEEVIAQFDATEDVDELEMISGLYVIRACVRLAAAQLAKAFSDLNLALSLNSQLAFPHFMRQEMYYLSYDFAKALSACGELKKFDNCYAAYVFDLDLRRAELCFQLGDVGETLASVRRVWDKNPLSPGALYYFTQCQVLLGNYHNLEDRLTDALVKKPDVTLLLIALPEVLLRTKKYNEAITATRKNIDSRASTIERYRAQFLDGINKEKSIRKVDMLDGVRALKTQCGYYIDAWIILLQAQHEQGHFKKVIELEGDVLLALTTVEDVHTMIEEWLATIDSTANEKLVELNLQDRTRTGQKIAAFFAEAFYQTGNLAKARKYANEGSECDYYHSYEMAICALGKVNIAERKLEKAIEDKNKLAALHPHGSGVAELVAALGHFAQNNRPPALKRKRKTGQLERKVEETKLRRK